MHPRDCRAVSRTLFGYIARLSLAVFALLLVSLVVIMLISGCDLAPVALSSTSYTARVLCACSSSILPP